MESAQLARDLASNAKDVEVRVVWNPSPFRVRHAIGAHRRPLLLCRAGGALDKALTSNDDGPIKEIDVDNYAAALSEPVM